MSKNGVLLEYARKMKNKERLRMTIGRMLGENDIRVIDRKTYRKLVKQEKINNEVEIIEKLSERVGLVYKNKLDLLEEERWIEALERIKKGEINKLIELLEGWYKELDSTIFVDAQVRDVLELMNKNYILHESFNWYEIKQLLLISSITSKAGGLFIEYSIFDNVYNQMISNDLKTKIYRKLKLKKKQDLLSSHAKNIYKSMNNKEVKEEIEEVYDRAIKEGSLFIELSSSKLLCMSGYCSYEEYTTLLRSKIHDLDSYYVSNHTFFMGIYSLERKEYKNAIKYLEYSNMLRSSSIKEFYLLLISSLTNYNLGIEIEKVRKEEIESHEEYSNFIKYSRYIKRKERTKAKEIYDHELLVLLKKYPELNGLFE